MTYRLTNKALIFATAAHGEQKRKYTGEPYMVHPIRVADILISIGAPDHVVAAAYMHDVLEDTPVTEEHIRTIFGDEVTNLIVEVTDVSRPGDGNRTTRKAKDRDHLAKASFWGQTIKLADLIDNMRDIQEHDPKFAKVFRREKNDLLTVMLNGHKGLWRKAMEAFVS